MSETQRYTILSFNDAQANRGVVTALRHSTIKALVRNGWAIYPKGWPSSTRRVARSAYVTSQGLRAAGYDMDALHAEAQDEDAQREQCGCTRNPLGHSRAEHPSRYASPVGGMALLGPELDAMRADAAYYQMSTEERDAHSSAYWESATAGLPREPAF